ncbi:MAG: bifunctional serine/threonine-protein kinase/formylglycine-generating enzyme family protein [Polyangiaceae bacterium]
MSTLQPGRVFARDFRVVKPLRAGGMGAVYIVDQLSTGKQRALKVMAPEIAQDPAVRERFILEARAASRIESDHVVEIVTAGIDDETHNLYLVMELLRGEELEDALIRMGPIPIADVAEVMSQLGHALEQAHKQGIVHRDLKPENIFLAVSKRKDVPFTVKILDFGIAKLVEGGMQKTGTQALGSPLYMAPEQTDRRGRICPQTDVWALGLVVFHLLTGRSYWRDAEDGSLASLIRSICVEPLPLASERAREMGFTLPPHFDAWFHRCVERQIEHRFADAGDAVRAFAQIVPPHMTERRLAPQVTTFTTGVQQHAPMTGVPMVSGPFEPRNTGAEVFKPTVIGESQFVGANTNPTPPPQKKGSSIAVPAIAAILVGGVIAGAVYVWKFRGNKPPEPAASSSAAPLVASAPPASASASATAAAPAGVCPEGMIFHEAGTMIMGSKEGGKSDSKPTHKVTVSAFCLDKFEVTAGLYAKCVEAGDCEKSPDGVQYPNITPAAKEAYKELCTGRNKDLVDHPINCVDWQMADTYCKWKKAALPTEAQWEYAARGKGQRDFPWGDDPPSIKRLNACGTECAEWATQHKVVLQAMYPESDGFFGTAPVGHFPEGASANGVMDLAGNVWEWTADWYGPYTEDAATDPKGAEKGDERVVRGGSFNGREADWAKPSFRWRSPPEVYNHAIGFRCAAPPTGAP